MMIRKFLLANPSILIFLGLLSLFTVLVVLLSEAFGLGLLSTSFVKTLGKTLMLCLVAIAMDLVWGYCGILSLGHFAFLALGGYMIGMWLMYARIEDVVIASSVNNAMPLTPFEIEHAVATQIFGVVGGSETPFLWYFADSLTMQLIFVLLVPSLLAFIFGWFAFRSKINGVYLSILTQAMTLALSLYLFQNDSGLRGNNGLSGLQNIPRLDHISQDDLSLYLFLLSAVFLAIGCIIALILVNSKLGLIIQAIRDNESRVENLGYKTEHYKLFIFTITAMMAAVAGAIYYPQAGIVNPAELAPIASIYLAVWVAIGGRGRIYGAVIGAAFVSLLSSWFTGGQAPDINLGIFVIQWTQWWSVLLGLSFVAVTLYAPKGIYGLIDYYQAYKGKTS